MPHSDESPQRTLAAAVVAMVGVALLVGVAVAGVILVVVRVIGLGDNDGPQEAAQPTMFIPELEPTTAPPSDSAPPPAATPTETPSATPEEAIRLEISPREAAPGDRLDLTGTYPGGDGASLQVQRKQGDGWIDFPVTAPVRSETFSTYIMTSRSGPSTFRMFDQDADLGSNTVTVTLG